MAPALLVDAPQRLPGRTDQHPLFSYRSTTTGTNPCRGREPVCSPCYLQADLDTAPPQNDAKVQSSDVPYVLRKVH